MLEWYLSRPLSYGIVSRKEGLIQCMGHKTRDRIHKRPISKLSQLEAEELLHQIVSSAGRDLKLVFQGNGLQGRAASGNFTLIARAMRYSRVHVGRVLTGKGQPSHNMLCRMAEVTRISVGEISEYIQGRRMEREEAA